MKIKSLCNSAFKGGRLLFFAIILVAPIFVGGFSNSSAQTTIISNPYSTTVNLGALPNSVSLNVVCTDLTYDLYQGLSDKRGDKSILNLQNFLYKTDYLRSTPNGYFGPATLSAVKSYQLSKGISNTGRVGPATRKSIRDNSCKVGNTASVINSIQIPTPTPAMQRINSTNLTITSPSASSTLVTDNKVTIRWNEVKGASYGITLEDSNGVGVGHIVSTVFGNNFEWIVGKVYSASSNSDIYVEPGIYRIKMTNSRYSEFFPDQYSGLFTILGKPLGIDSVVPSFVSKNDDSSVVLFGRGFDNTTTVNYDVGNNGRVEKPIFVSSNGKVLVFSVSDFIKPGQYYVTVNNKYDSGATSTPSNSVKLLITD